MVKGITKQVVMVKPDGGGLFEQAIFVVKEGAGITPEQVMEEANRAAKAYVRGTVRGARGQGMSWSSLMSFLAGGGMASLIWWLA